MLPLTSCTFVGYRFFVATSVLLCAVPAATHAQANSGPPQRTDRIATNPFAEPPPPDDPNEPDPAKRKNFLWWLGRKRLPGNCLWNVDSLTSEAARDIPKETKTQAMENWLTLLNDDLMPPSEEEINWYGTWVSSPRGLQLYVIVGEWTTDGYLIRFSQLVDSDRYCSATVRAARRPTLQFRRRPPNLDARGDAKWDTVPQKQVKDVLNEITGREIKAAESRGYITGSMDIPVFTGTFHWPSAAGPVNDETPAGAAVPEYPRPNHILITDSDPQYVCVRFEMHPEG
jgi:hypothetical protein